MDEILPANHAGTMPGARLRTAIEHIDKAIEVAADQT
jgi:hypothetical protein